MDDTLEVAFISHSDASQGNILSDSERQEFVGLFAGWSEECLDFEENRCAPWYYHPEEPWSRDIPDLLSWVYVTFPESQKPPFALLFAAMSHCVRLVKPATVDGIFIRVGSFEFSLGKQNVSYGQSSTETSSAMSRLQRFVGAAIPRVIFPDVRGESYLEIVAENFHEPQQATVTIEYADQNIEPFWDIFSELVQHHEKHIFYCSETTSCNQAASSTPCQASPNSRRSDSRQVKVDVWDPIVIGRLTRIIFQALHLANISYPLAITIEKC